MSDESFNTEEENTHTASTLAVMMQTLWFGAKCVTQCIHKQTLYISDVRLKNIMIQSQFEEDKHFQQEHIEEMQP